MNTQAGMVPDTTWPRLRSKTWNVQSKGEIQWVPQKPAYSPGEFEITSRSNTWHIEQSMFVRDAKMAESAQAQGD